MPATKAIQTRRCCRSGCSGLTPRTGTVSVELASEMSYDLAVCGSA